MKSKNIYLIRHGQTDYNIKGIVQGSGVDSSLNKTGKQQADAFYAAYKNFKFDKVYTSKLKRSKESVRKFIENGLPHEEFEGLNEISWGTREGCRVTPEEDAYYWDVLGQWAEGNTSLRIEGGESPEDVYKRQVPVLEYILNKKDEKNILICMHGRAMRILLCNLLNYPLCEMDVFEHTNLCLYKLRYTGTMCTVELFNETSHLEILNRL